MILIHRFPEPERLAANKEKWLAAYLEKCSSAPGSRPSSRQYGHDDIRQVLLAMSHNKCFYCERKLSESETQVEHFIEVSEVPEKAFEWTNLYLSCQSCNQHKRRRTYNISECLDPCDVSLDPSEHLTFDDEFIRARNQSIRGLKTIQKFRLDSDELNHLRVKQLHIFERFLRKLTERLRVENRGLTDNELEILHRFTQPHHEYSLMFRVYLSEVGL